MKLVWITDDRGPVARELARHLTSEGYRVAINHLGGEAVDGCVRTQARLSRLSEVEQCVESFGEDFWAAIHPAPPPVHGTIEGADDAAWEAGLEQGALASLMVARAAGGRLKELGRGALIFLGNIHAEKPMGNGFLHTMGLSATQMLSREAAIDFGAKGVTCVHVQRGIMRGDMGNKNDYTNLYGGTDLRYPKKAFPTTDSLNGLIAFLLTDAAAPLNGADLRADYGLTMYYGNQREGVPPT